MRKRIAGLILIVITLDCQTDKTPLDVNDGNNEKPDPYTRTISGYVQMEHQTNHDNCAVFLDSVNIGTYTDSTGFYKLALPDSVFKTDTLLIQGRFKLYFYSFNYELDSLYVALGQKGFVKDSLAIDGQGRVKDILVKQVFSIKLVTDTTYYAVGDTIWMTMFMKKFGTDTIEIKILESVSGEIGPVFVLYSLPYNYHVALNQITSEAEYRWSDITVVIELIGFWSLHERFFSFYNYPVGNYELIPHVLKWGQWWKMPDSLQDFLPRTQFIDSNYLYHPKKFDTPTVYLDSTQVRK